MKIKDVSARQLERYPHYLKYLESISRVESRYISSAKIAKDLDLTEEQVRKDLQKVSKSSGKPRLGRPINELIFDLQKFLGYTEAKKACVIGCGNLGRAFLNYKGFREFGLDVVCGFDVDPQLIGTDVHGKIIYSLLNLNGIVYKESIEICLLTVPDNAVDNAVDLIKNTSIKGIWNFTSVKINHKDNLKVENSSLASSFAKLVHKL